MSEFSKLNASWYIKLLCVGVCQTKLPLFTSSAVTSPKLFIKKTISSFKIIESFFCDFIKELSVLKFHNSFPSFVDMALIILSKS